MVHDVNLVQLYIVLMKDGRPIFVEKGPFHQDDEVSLQEECDELNKKEHTGCAYVVARRDYCVTGLEIPDL